MSKPLPEKVFVTREEDGDDSYLVAHEDLNSTENGAIVGTYVLNTTDTLQVKRVLVPSDK